MSSKTSKLIRDLDSVPSIVGNLGLSIAAAQKAFNLDYLDSLERLVVLIKSMLGSETLNEKDRAFFESVLTQLAPPAYQYTETTLSVRFDLAQSQRTAAAASLGGGIGAVTVSASLSAAFGLDYRAAAECRTLIQARTLDPEAMKALFDRATALGDKALELPADTARIDHEIVASAKSLVSKVTEGNRTVGGATTSDPTPSEASGSDSTPADTPADSTPTEQG